MTKPSGTIIFFGNERLATGLGTEALTLRALLENGYNVAAVVANYTPANSRNSRELEVATIAKEHNIPVLLPDRLKSIKDQLVEYNPTIGMLVAYGKIIPQEIIDIFPRGIINLHPSLLPKHRGPTPIESVILQGETKTGVSIMQLAKEMDAGPIFAQAEIELSGTEAKSELAANLLELGSTMIVELLPDILNDTAAALPQDESAATYDQLISKDAGLIDWHKPAEQLEREVRAFIEWPKSRTTLGTTEVIITKATVTDSELKPGEISAKDRRLLVGTGDQALEILELKPAGKSTMKAAAFLAGYKLAG